MYVRPNADPMLKEITNDQQPNKGRRNALQRRLTKSPSDPRQQPVNKDEAVQQLIQKRKQGLGY